MVRTLLVSSAVAVLCTATGATAATLITGAQVKNGSLSGKDVRDRSIKRVDLAKTARGLKGPAGDRGQTGPVGPQGPKGDNAGLTVHTEQGAPVLVAPGELTAATARCSSGQVVGGVHKVEFENPDTKSYLRVSVAETRIDNGVWSVTIQPYGTYPLRLTATAICVG